MTKYKVQSLSSLEAEMKAVARGKRKAPADAAQPSFNSVEALLRLLTPENRALLATLRKHKPGSIAELATLTGRAAPNVTRTIGKLVSAGLVELKTVKRRKVPVAIVSHLRIDIDPFAQKDQVEFA